MRHHLRGRPQARGPEGLRAAARRRAVERTLGWLMLHRRLAPDYETLPERSAVIFWAMTDNMSRRLTGETTPTWRDHNTETGEPSLT